MLRNRRRIGPRIEKIKHFVLSASKYFIVYKNNSNSEPKERWGGLDRIERFCFLNYVFYL